MKKLFTLLAVVAFSVLMLAQDNSQSSQSQSSQSQPQATTPSQSQSSQGTSGSASNSSSSGQRMSGKVSSNGKTFTDDASGKSYKVSNPDALQNYDNQHVVVLVQTDPNTGDVTITAVQPPQ